MSIHTDRQAAEILRVADEEVLTGPARWTAHHAKEGRGRWTLYGAVREAAKLLGKTADDAGLSVAYGALDRAVVAIKDITDSFAVEKRILIRAREINFRRISLHEGKISRAKAKRQAARRKAQREARKAARTAVVIQGPNHAVTVGAPAPKVRAKPALRTSAARSGGKGPMATVRAKGKGRA